jgi:hypothetical protein
MYILEIKGENMNLDVEKNIKLSSQDVYEVIDFAMQSAEDNGFINNFVFERALYCYAAMLLLTEEQEGIAANMTESPLKAWDYMLEKDIVNRLLEEYAEECDYIADNASVWNKEYVEYSNSARGVLAVAQQFSGDVVQEAAKVLNQVQDPDSDIQKTISIADKWGMTDALFVEK